MKEIIDYFNNTDAFHFIVGVILFCCVVRYCYEILTGKD